MRITIRSRILSIFVGVALIQALLLGAFFLYQHNQSRRKLVDQQLHSANDTVSSQIHTFCERILHDLETASQQVERMAQKDYQQYNLLKTLQNNNDALAGLAFYDINGVVRSAVIGNTYELSPTSFTDSSVLFDAPYSSETPFVTQLTSTEGSLLLGFSQPIFFLDHSYIIGVISALVPMDTLQEIIDQHELPPNQNLLVLNSDGKVLAERIHNDTVHTSFPADTNWDGDVFVDGTHHISVSSSFDFHGNKFIVSSTIDARKSLMPAGKSFLLFIFLILLLLLLSALVGWTTNNRIVAPLQLLANTSATMIQGKKVGIALPEDAELYELANALDTMNQQLQESNAALTLQEKSATTAKIEAEKANQAKSIFLANMSHEIRTPLHAIIGVLKMLDKEPLSTEQGKLLAIASVSGQRLHNVVNSILDISQIESGKLELHQSPFSLSALITEVVELMRIQTQNNPDLTIRANLAEDIPDRLEGDSGRIRQILINLINNSIKFSKQGLVLLTVELLSTSGDEGVELLFSVKDTGNGISDEAKERIFNAFEREDIKVDNVVEGIGLGLVISGEFAQHMGGKLWLERSDEMGSTFCFTIRCLLAPEELQERDGEKESGQSAKKLSGIRILLAEDEFINQRIISAYIEEMGGQATVCENGQELLDRMKVEEADIILMDIRMPVLDGLEATKIIRQEEADSNRPSIPIVALTAQATTEFEEKCRQAGMDGYLTKPIPFDRLSQIICELTRK